MRARGTGDHSEHEPDTRALAAMAEAARRSRQLEVGATPRRSHARPPAPPRPARPGDADRPPASTTPTASTRRSRRQRRSALILGLVVVLVGLVGWSAARGRSTSTVRAHPVPVTRSGAQLPYTSPGGRPATGPPATAPVTPPTSETAPTAVPATAPTTTPSPPQPLSGAAPSLTALDPSTGSPGQVLVIDGSNLLSPSGQITAQFGGQTTTVACPQSTSCLIEVPSTDGSTGTAQVSITTDGGTSNPLTFTYE